MSHPMRKNMSHPMRKKKFVDVRVQGTLVRRLVCHWIAFIGIAGFSALILQVCTNPFRSFEDHFNGLWFSHGPLLVSLVFLLPVFVVDMIALSHRFAGPVVRLRHSLRSIAAGEGGPRLRFRDHDFWQELADDYNAALDALEGCKGEPPSAGGKPAESAITV